MAVLLCLVGWRGCCGQGAWDPSPHQLLPPALLLPCSPPRPGGVCNSQPCPFEVRGVFAEGEEEVVKPLMKLALLPAILSGAMPCCRCPPQPWGCWGAALVRLHEMHIEKCGVLVCFFKMPKK